VAQESPVGGRFRSHSIAILRVSLGIVFFAFGILKFFPGASPAEALVECTINS
jgi:putative oxidoreductase